jgi:hypothetical protein
MTPLTPFVGRGRSVVPDQSKASVERRGARRSGPLKPFRKPTARDGLAPAGQFSSAASVAHSEVGLQQAGSRPIHTEYCLECPRQDSNLRPVLS